MLHVSVVGMGIQGGQEEMKKERITVVAIKKNTG